MMEYKISYHPVMMKIGGDFDNTISHPILDKLIYEMNGKFNSLFYA
jgi:hypothetical protein